MTKRAITPAAVLLAMQAGFALKSHRYLDGTKVYRLHPLAGPAQVIERTVVEALQAGGLISSNQKFPVATFFLTEQGRLEAGRLAEMRVK